MSKNITEWLKLFGVMILALLLLIVAGRIVHFLCLLIGFDDMTAGMFSFIGVLLALVLSIMIMLERKGAI